MTDPAEGENLAQIYRTLRWNGVELTAPDCDTCNGAPPTGFTCQTCGKEAQ